MQALRADEIEEAWVKECQDRLRTCNNLKDGNEVFKKINSAHAKKPAHYQASGIKNIQKEKQ